MNTLTNFRPNPAPRHTGAFGTQDTRRPTAHGRAYQQQTVGNDVLHKRVVNKEVSITSLYFQNGRELKSFPKRMEFEGREYTFIESGLRYLIQKGQQFIQVFDMTDGERKYRLKFDANEHTWTLIGMMDLPRAMA